MIVTLIGKNVLYKTELPTYVDGNYWMLDKNGKKFFSINAIDNKWKIVSNNNAKIIKPKSMTSVNIFKIAQKEDNIIEEITLKNHGMYYIYLKDYPNEIFVIYCTPKYEEGFIQLDIKNTQDILIGNSDECDIKYDNPLVKPKHARMFFSNGKLMIENFDEDFGVFVNNNAANNKLKMLFNGDVVFIMGLKIIILGRNIYINNPIGRVTYNENIFDVHENQIKIKELEEDDDTEIELYEEKDYFARSPRITNIIEREKIKIDLPPTSETKDSMPLLLTLGSSLSMGIIMLMSIISTIDGMANGQTNMKSTVISIITSVIFFISILLFPILTKKWEKKQKEKNEQKRQKRYKKYINSKIQLIDDIMKKQKEIMYNNYISGEECAKIVTNNGPRLWERKIEDGDFLTIRIGVGNRPIEADIEYPEVEFTMEDDNLVEILNTIVKKSKIIKNVPITIPLTEKYISAMIVKNDERLTEKFVQNLLIQLIALHSYEDLKLVFLLKEDKSNKWEHLKTIPHIWDNTKQIRFWAEDYNDMREVSSYLEVEFENRVQYETEDYKAFSPYYLIITDDYKKIENLSIINKILNTKRNVGFGIFCITNNLLDLPNGCKTFINLENNHGEMFNNEISSKGKLGFEFDSSYTFFFETIGKELSNIPIKYEASGVASLPNNYTFLEMFDAGRIEQLNILERWRNNNAINSLQTVIGIDQNGMPIILDIHEKFHGPHGLIAGGTGSGKTEFIKTFILSLAINYHPNDVTFILIDYKGGDLAGAFKQKSAQIPHLVGTITNIETAGLQRSLASIKSELRRRQVLFDEAKKQIDEGNLDIYKYQKLYHQRILKEPIPHLLIICDEFAELKQQQEEFMDELISVARIGRSLGVHLILATQKPAGIVNDQIRSNSKFGVCLKVQETTDSIDVIKRPDAAYLKRAGEFYLQVGNNDYFTLGLAGWAGAPYMPADVIKKDIDTSIKFVSDIGAVIKEVGKQKKNAQNSNGEQLTNIVKYMDKIANQEKIKARPLWLENIPEIIYIKDIRKKYQVKKENNIIKPIIGEYDDPYNQRQGALELNLSKNGNVVIYGNAESGKETLLGTIAYDIMTNYTADEAQIYILDFGSEALKIFKDSPVVGDVVFAHETEKVSRFFDMLQKEIKRRTTILSNYNGDYNLYLNTSDNKMPMLVVIINNYETFLENYEKDFEDVLLSLTREGLKYGIVFVVTTSTYNGLRYRLSQNFIQRLALQLNNSDDYLNIFDNVGKKRPQHLFGRGLVKLDNIYEFQTARICETENWNAYIKKVNEELTKKSKCFAKKIPILPEKVVYEDVKKDLESIAKVPIGINRNSLETYSYNFKKELINIITGKSISSIVEFAMHIIEEVKQLDNVEVKVFDSELMLQNGKNSIKESYQEFVQKINNNLGDKNIVCIIIGIDKFINDIDGGERDFYNMLAQVERTKKYNFIIADSLTKFKNHEYDTWYKEFISKEKGIWVGNGINDQYLININFGDRNIVNKCGNSFGYAINQEHVIPLKLLGLKENGDEDE